jgi:hypothetical protein
VYTIESYDISGGTQYTAGDFLQLVGGVSTTKPVLFQVTATDASAVTGSVILINGAYTSLPAEPYSVVTLGSIGNGATVSITWTRSCP